MTARVEEFLRYLQERRAIVRKVLGTKKVGDSLPHILREGNLFALVCGVDGGLCYECGTKIRHGEGLRLIDYETGKVEYRGRKRARISTRVTDFHANHF